jgi:hypothetical protein
MIQSYAKNGGTYGVSHNEKGILLSVNGERVLLTLDETESLIARIQFAVTEHSQGLWCGKPIERTGWWPTFAEYGGGGTILNMHTSDENIISNAPVDLLEMIRLMIRDGLEVMISNEKIVAAQKYSKG